VRLGAEEPFTRYYAAAAHALKGDTDTAVAFLERAAADQRAFTLARARIEPEFEALAGDDRFQRLLATLPQAGRGSARISNTGRGSAQISNTGRGSARIS
jgi:hypothetical protein